MLALCAGPAEAAADQASILYVNNGTGSNCSDAGVGTQAVPFCTIQAAADVAGPGQTVQISYGTNNYPGEVDLTRSGNQGAPITFTTDPNPTTRLNPRVNLGGTHAFTLTGVHDIVLSGLNASSSGAGIVITDSSRIDLDEDFLDGSSGQATTPSDGVDITGQSSAVTISRSVVGHYGGTGISVGTGVTGTVLTTNAVDYNAGYGIMLSDATNAVLTSNTVAFNCGSGVLIGGASTGTTLENNILTANAQQPTQDNEYPCVVPAGAELSVAATATASTTADYNVAYPTQSDAPYSWGGVSYADAVALQGVTGQGTHDLNTDPQLRGPGVDASPLEGTPEIDSANANAPDELATDGYGRPRRDDPTVANTGTGMGYLDRGAYEFQDPFRLGRPTQRLSGSSVFPVQDSVTAAIITNPWSDTITYTINFGDGSAPVTTSAPTVTHTYTAPGTFTVTMTATLSIGSPVTASSSITVYPPGPLTPELSIQTYPSYPLLIGISAWGSSAGVGRTITDYSVDFGDGSAPIDMGTATSYGHTYSSPGTYTVTLTITDSGGRTASTTQNVTVGSM